MFSRHIAGCLAVLGILVVATCELGWADNKYGGVDPAKQKLKQRQCKPKPTGATVTWLGFKPSESGGARVFVQICGSAAASQEVSGEKVVIRLPGTRFASRNTNRNLDARFFETPLALISARGVNTVGFRGTSISVGFKLSGYAKKVPAEQRNGRDGYTFWYFNFPPADGELPDPGKLRQ